MSRRLEVRGDFSVFYQDLPAVQCVSVFAAQNRDGSGQDLDVRGLAQHKF